MKSRSEFRRARRGAPVVATRDGRAGIDAELRAIAREAYVYGFPLVDGYRVLHARFVDEDAPEYRGPPNVILEEPGPYATDEPPTADADVLGASSGADLRAEPLVLGVPALDGGRWFAAQLVDLYGHNFAYLGSRTTGTAGGTYLLAGPGWEGTTPDGIDGVIRAETTVALVRYRVQLRGAADVEHARAILGGCTVRPLSAYLGLARPPAPVRAGYVEPLRPGQERSSLEFFEVLNGVLRFCAIHPSERAMLERFGRIGVGTDGRYSARDLSPEEQIAIAAGMGDAWRECEALARKQETGELRRAELYGTREQFGGDYLRRMLGAVEGIHGDSREEAIALDCTRDAERRPLDGAVARYTLRFEPARLPPVRGFWSLTMYALPARRLVPGRERRYVIDSTMLAAMRRDPDGGVTLHLQREAPDAASVANWLPAPAGPFVATLRLYWPEPEAIEGGWTPPPLVRTDGTDGRNGTDDTIAATERSA